ncbi:MAG: ROK family glucokinase [Solirubrobacteraceae bacterium]
MSGPLIGVDVGGTKVSVAAFGAEPHVQHTDKSALIEQITRAIGEAAGGLTPAAVGVGLPSVVEFATGRVRSSVNIPLRDVPLREVLTRELGCPVFVDNDATVAALAEAHDERGRLDARHLVMLTVGTGVGGGIVIDGRPFRGATGAAGELGHTLIAADPDGRAGAHFPQPGSLEALAAGHVLDRLAAEAAADHPESALGRMENPSGPDAVQAAHDGDQVAIAAIERLGRRLGIGIANAINTFDPDVVAIGGGVSAAGDLLLEPARASAAGYVLSGVGTRTEIRIARSGPMAGVRGAALLARSELEMEKRET